MKTDLDEMEPELEVDGLSFTYENRAEPALNDVDLRMTRGEFILLAGASGSGKSTLLKCINGLIPHRYVGAYSGQVRVRGAQVSALPFLEISLIVGTVLQEVDKQLVSSTVEGDVAFGPSNLALPREVIDSRVRRSLDETGILSLRNRSIFALSGGQKQRLAIADILAMEPSIILFDEPLANLDSNGVRLMQEVFENFHKEGKTVVVAEHRTEEVLAAKPDRVLVIDHGHVLADGTDPALLAEFADIVKVPVTYALKNIWQRGLHLKQTAPRRRSPGAEIVRCDEATFVFPGGFKALDRISLVVRGGERVALLGNNGAGKSTLGLCLSGLLKPTEGVVLLEGKSTTQLSIERVARSVAIVSQSPFSMLFSKTVRDELAFGPKNIGYSKEEIEKIVPETAQRCAISQLLDGSPFATSFGEKKRVCVASVLTMLPKCIILDEPTAGQDYGNYTGFMDFIDSLGERVQSFVLITHDPDLAIQYTDRTVILAEGKILADGPTKTLLADSELIKQGAIRETSLMQMSKKATGGMSVLTVQELARLSR